MDNFSGKRVLVVGLGKSGAAAARFLAGRGARVTVTDLKEPEQLRPYRDLCRDLPLQYELGMHRTETFLESDLIVLSPGVSRRSPPVSLASRRGIPLTNEVSLALERIEAPVIGVTGSAGKTTTCTLIARMLEAGGRKVFLGGNIGTPLLHLVESGEKVDFVVAELSSFQLELVAPFVPMAAVFTPIAQDHLDRYDSMSDYVAAKRRLAEFCETRSTIIFSRENPWHAQIVAGVRGTLFPYSKIPEALPSGGAIYYRSEKKIVCGDQVFDMSRCPAGDKNIENIMAAASTAGVAGIRRDAIQTVIDGFQGIAHRLEWVRQCKGVTFFNDSKATNVISVLNALDQFEDQSVVLLVGGKNKAIDFSPLSESVKRKCKLVVAFGEARVALASTLEAVVPVLQADSFRDAVETAASRADSGDNVVLSPACASHDMFANYEERGNLFKSLVGEL